MLSTDTISDAIEEYGIRLLPNDLINKIAAGEVIERPASAVKELVENSIDAGATKIEIIMRNGGRTFISVTDNGCGMSKRDLVLAVERHATSKLPTDNLDSISTLGFRGEALPSIGAVSRLTIKTRSKKMDTGWSINVTGGDIEAVVPSSLKIGTQVEIRDLFYATPARLKFLKTDRTETGRTIEMIRRIAMVNPNISFTLNDGTRTNIRFNGAQGNLPNIQLSRIGEVLGRDFEENSVLIEAEREGFILTGYAGLPTLNKRTSSHQFLFVNGRSVQDKLLYGAVRAAYSDFLAYDRHPFVVLFLNAPGSTLDVNVHPAKSEVRFQEPGLVRGLIIGALKKALLEAGYQTSSTISNAALGILNKSISKISPTGVRSSGQSYKTHEPSQNNYLPSSFANSEIAYGHLDLNSAPMARTDSPSHQSSESLNEIASFPLGAAQAQLHKNYIVAQTNEGLVIVDQHAAHERLVYEKMKIDLKEGGIKRQVLLIPEVVDLEHVKIQKLLELKNDFARLGLILEKFGEGAILVREIPSILGDINVKNLIIDIVDELEEFGSSTVLEDKLGHICGTIACHSSVRSGRTLRVEEMNALLREMEATPHSGQCNHGRPTYVELKLSDIEKLFGRR
ncbi:MAG: DNA mismatch repair endonuclease MutL [Rhodospirillaceae bacterium]|nr:DNA mismatch repair endonuclease MutL [Rhodospirillaceae bacterium]OUU14955.1 MAG: DNA mismatch repair protein MutL [Candidatus Endolissoclinum sp. TMED37]